jgi:TRAP-type C4-dicarboxylate transport system permease small subunit
MAILGFLGFLIYYGIFLTSKTIDVRTAALSLPWGLVYLSAPACAVLMVIHTIKLIVDDIYKLTGKSTEADR